MQSEKVVPKCVSHPVQSVSSPTPDMICRTVLPPDASTTTTDCSRLYFSEFLANTNYLCYFLMGAAAHSGINSRVSFPSPGY